MWIGGGIVLLLLIVGVVLLRMRSGDDASVPIIKNTSKIEKKAEKPSQEEGVPLGTLPPDADSDGVSDAIEQEKGTDPQKGDTDGDGFSDREELYDRNSDPKKADEPTVHPFLRT